MVYEVSPYIPTPLRATAGAALYRGLNDYEKAHAMRHKSLTLVPRTPPISVPRNSPVSVVESLEFQLVSEPSWVVTHVLEIERRALSLSLEWQTAVSYALHDHHGRLNKYGAVALTEFPSAKPAHVGGDQPAIWTSGDLMLVDPRHLYTGRFEQRLEMHNRASVDSEILLVAGALHVRQVIRVTRDDWDGTTLPWAKRLRPHLIRR